MPTLDQLPQATTVNATDEMLIEQNGQSMAATVAQVLASTQPKLSLPGNTLLGRVSLTQGDPETVTIGTGLMVASGTLEADTNVLAPLASPAFTGVPTAPNPPSGDSSNAIATTAWVQAQTAAKVVLSGDVSGSGSSTLNVTLPTIVTPGTYTKVQVNAKGQVISGLPSVATDVTGALGFTPYDAANPAGYVSAAGVPLVPVTAPSGTTARSIVARAGDQVNLLDFGADPTGSADSLPAFNAAIASVTAGAGVRVFVPRGMYRLSGVVSNNSRLVTVVFDDGADITGPGYLGVARVEARRGDVSWVCTGQGWFGFPSIASAGVENISATNTSSVNRTQRSFTYTGLNSYGKSGGQLDLAVQGVYSWSRLYDNTGCAGHWEVVNPPVLDEYSRDYAGLATSVSFAEYDVVSNFPETGWTDTPSVAVPASGVQVDPSGQNSPYVGGHIFYAYGTFGGVPYANNRWWTYPAVFSTISPGSVGRTARW